MFYGSENGWIMCHGIASARLHCWGPHEPQSRQTDGLNYQPFEGSSRFRFGIWVDYASAGMGTPARHRSAR